jgi:uncharacterized membrane protein
MRTWNTILYNLAFAANILLLFFVFTERWVEIPVWLQVAGRMHPLLLHFPIVLVLLCIVLEWIRPDREQDKLLNGLWLITLNLTVFSALFGWILSREEGYESDVVSWHKWGGVAVSFFSLIWYHYRKKIQQRKAVLTISSTAMLFGLLITGHQGAVLTHGDDFLMAPLLSAKKAAPVPFDQAIVFDHVVKPILEAKCISCHNSSKAKGELVMETAESLLKGGKTGLLWDSTAQDYGLLLKRVHLPVDSKEHMPPKGKPQLTDEDIAILYHWIKSGAKFETRLADLPQTDTLRILTASMFSSQQEEQYHFAAASESVIEKLNSHYRVVQPVAAESPALEVNYFGASQFNAAGLKDLLQVKEQVVSLNLSKMPVTDTDVDLISQLINLRNLNLSFTSITDKALPYLKKLAQLKTLSISGTAITKAGLAANPLPVSRLVCWNIGLKPEDLGSLATTWKDTRFETGFAGDTILMQLNEPIVENEETIFKKPFKLKLRHYVQGVELRYTLDGSEPDSIHSPLYDPELTISSTLTFKARAFKKGWISSSTVTRDFIASGLKPDSVQLVTAPDPSYSGSGGKTLIDDEVGELNFRNGRWLGYRNGDMVAVLYFNKPQTLKTISVSAITDPGVFIMPPREIQVYEEEGAGNWKLIAKDFPRQLTKDTAEHVKRYALPLGDKSYNKMKLVVKPLGRLPNWHPGKGEPGWVFVDELFFEN